jgi:putative SOS response-associated peptidase YedK
VVRSFTIITTTLNEVCAPIHDRMPVIVEQANYGKWLGEEAIDPVRSTMMRPYPIDAARRMSRHGGTLRSRRRCRLLADHHIAVCPHLANVGLDQLQFQQGLRRALDL